MKKIKLLAPIVAVASIGSTIVPLATLTSCGKSTISLDGSTTAETSTSLTTTSYTFNVSNYDETTDDIDAEITEQASTADVKVEIVNIVYDKETKKLTVYVSIYKEEGELNESEEVSFSINFKCKNKESKAEKWAKKIEKLKIIHHVHEQDQHFCDIDTTKILVTDKKESNAFELTFTCADEWATKETEGSLLLSNLNVTLVQHGLYHHSFEQRITLGDITKTYNATSGTMTISVPYDTTNAQEQDFVSFGLLFTYYDEDAKENSFIQTLSGFAVKYQTEASVQHIWLAGSREVNYYGIQGLEGEEGTNFLTFYLDDNEVYDSTKFVIESSSDKVKLDECEVITLTIFGEDHQCLVVPYTFEAKQGDPTIFNISFTIKYSGDKTWTKKFSGFTISQPGRGFVPFNLISFHENKLPTTFTLDGKTTLTDVFTTVSPIEDMWLTGAIIDDSISADVNVVKFTFRDETEIELDTTSKGLTAAEHKVKFIFYIGTEHAAFKYSMTLEKINFQ